MRTACLLVTVIGCSSAPPRSTERPPHIAAAPITPDAATTSAVDPDDPDGDTIRGHCDLCPNEPETWNGILDEDGCPDSSGASHAVIEHPTNRYAYPNKVRFRGDEMIDPINSSMFDDGIEAIEVIARSRVDVKPAVASKRAAIVAKHVRGAVLQSVRVAERVTGAVRVYVDDDVIDDPDADVVVQVMRARTVEIWKWEDDHLVRATPRARLPIPKLPPGCGS